MEEENRKGPGVFYAVVGVATLVVAIIGATFAYFSASVTGTGSNIEGQTNGDLVTNMTLKVDKLRFSAAQAASNDLVPAVLDGTVAGVNRALTAGCTNDGFTGCHVYKITATSTAAVTTANLKLDLSVDATTKTNWKYLVYTGSDTTSEGSTTAASATTVTTASTSLATAASGVDIFMPTGGLEANTPKVWYLMVYLENVNSSQNDGQTENTTDETGSYSGSVTLQAAGGQVKASFAG